VRPARKRQDVPEWTWLAHELTWTGAFGDPSLARAELGERTWAVWAEALALFHKRLADDKLESQ
jgi:creatinine amidohydrolase/Fe(II)-dependent formamide hydrolase-like protein